MGTQQILLIALGVIIVAVAVIVGISLFGGGAYEANKEAISNDLLAMASAAQGYFKKPADMGGGGESFVGITLTDLGMKETHASFSGAASYSKNENARYVIRSAAQGTLVIEGISETETGTDGKPATVRATITEANVSTSFLNW